MRVAAFDGAMNVRGLVVLPSLQPEKAKLPEADRLTVHCAPAVQVRVAAAL
ncbi:MAG: hypothetical protein WB676_00810 [Bryobacteraceae bacterium]